jgi:hypothetical protein
MSTEMCLVTGRNRLHTPVEMKKNDRITNISNNMLYRNVKECVGSRSSDRSP